MQASGAYAPSPYQNPYHIVIPGPQDYELKKQYLALLPPQQIIDICLNFDLHVPPFVKSSIWPADINAAIRAIQKSSPSAPEPPSALTSDSNESHPQTDPSQSELPSEATSTSIEKPSEDQPPDKPSLAPDPSSSTQTSTQPSPNPQGPTNSDASTSQNPTATQTPYPHQPYGYGPTAAYPHAPYYQTAPGYPYPSPYPYGPYPPGYPQQPSVPFGTPPPQPPTQDAFNPPIPPSTDDLPSYEEMIVEALNDSADPEGCAPKDLFTWMASRYPLQSNFRPSASQALQKAFKRGRFEKSSSGKYRLNASWEGGNTSRRATRRPQTQNAAPQAPAPPPFTHAPLVHHQQPQSGYQHSPYGYLYAGQSGYPGYPPPPQTAKAQQNSQPPAATHSPNSSVTDAPKSIQAEGTAQDAWEAAQNILKAINFDSLLRMPKDDEIGGQTAIAASTSSQVVIDPVLSSASSTGVSNPEATGGAGRAELQANLALLAAQLAEIAQEHDGEAVVHYPVFNHNAISTPAAGVPDHMATTASVPIMSSLTTPSLTVLPQSRVVTPGSLSENTSNEAGPPTKPPAEAQEEEETSDDDMEEVI